MSNETLLDAILAACTRLERIEQHLARIAEALTEPNMPRSYRTSDSDSGVSEWLAGRG